MTTVVAEFAAVFGLLLADTSAEAWVRSCKPHWIDLDSGPYFHRSRCVGRRR